MLQLSAANLIKQSAKQIWYLREHPDKVTVSPQQIQGVEEQRLHTISPYVEMRGTWTRDDVIIYFSVDEIQVKKKTATLIEHKMLLDEPENWYFQRSINQAGAYHALVLEASPVFETADFYTKMGNEKKFLDLESYVVRSRLRFGRNLYDISVDNPAKLVNLLFSKAKATAMWNVASRFDEAQFHKSIGKLVTERHVPM